MAWERDLQSCVDCSLYLLNGVAFRIPAFVGAHLESRDQLLTTCKHSQKNIISANLLQTVKMISSGK